MSVGAAGTIRDLDHRRGWARIRAAMACLLGVTIFALSCAALVFIGFAAAARAWSWATKSSFVDSPVWSWAPGGAGALAASAVLLSFLGTFWYFWWGAARQVLAETRARPLRDGEYTVLRNVVEALSIGIGRTPPALYVAEEPAPNALSIRARRRRILVVTTGCSTLGRDQLEAVCAHEIGHLWATDAHWVTSGMVALARARRFGGLIVALGIGVLGLVYLAWSQADTVLWTTGLTGLALVALGAASRGTLRRIEKRVRREADEIADVAAIKLAKNPASLGSVCAELAGNADRVSHVGWRSELMWFEMVEADDDVATTELNRRSHRELVDRAVAAYATANTPLPDRVAELVAARGRR